MSKIFNSIEDINKTYGVSLKLPTIIPNYCNIFCYKVKGLYDLTSYGFYRETHGGLFYYNHMRSAWLETGNITLEQEVLDDTNNDYNDLIYLRLTPEQPKENEMFTPERLLGVETTLGFIVDVFDKVYTNPLTCFFFETTDGTSYSTYNDGVKFYISDDSDETVSFEEYVKLFYNTENT